MVLEWMGKWHSTVILWDQGYFVAIYQRLSLSVYVSILVQKSISRAQIHLKGVCQVNKSYPKTIPY